MSSSDEEDFFSPPNYPQSDSSRVAFMNKKKVLFTNLLMILKSSPSILVLLLVFLKLLLIVYLKTHFDSRFSKDSLIHSYNLSFFSKPLCPHACSFISLLQKITYLHRSFLQRPRWTAPVIFIMVAQSDTWLHFFEVHNYTELSSCSSIQNNYHQCPTSTFQDLEGNREFMWAIN